MTGTGVQAASNGGTRPRSPKLRTRLSNVHSRIRRRCPPRPACLGSPCPAGARERHGQEQQHRRGHRAGDALVQPSGITIRRLAAEFRIIDDAQQLTERHLGWTGDQKVEIARHHVARPRHMLEPSTVAEDLRAGDVVEIQEPSSEHRPCRVDLGDQVALGVTPENGQAVQLELAGIDRLDARMSAPRRSQVARASSLV